MPIKVQTADLHRHREIIIDALGSYLTSPSDEKRFEWLYAQNSHNQARAWLAVDDATHSVVGAAAAFSRRFYFANNEVLAWVFGDFCLDARYRSLGPALQLQRACLSVLETTQGAFCYDFPSASMVAVYTRLGVSVSGTMLRLAKPLRVDRKVKEIIKHPTTQRVVASVGNTLLKMSLLKAAADHTLELSVYKRPFGEEFTVFAEEQGGKFGICLQRSADYLNWRYLNNPLARHEIVTARKNNRLVGYAVWMQNEEDASIVDLFGEENPATMKHLIAEIVALAQNRGVMTLSVSVNESHPWLSVFSEMGFRLRDSCPAVIIPSKTFAGKINPQLTGWYLMQGDRDS